MGINQIKRCPKCNAIYETNHYMGIPSKNNQLQYGSPVRICPHCKALFRDDNYHEIAVDGIRNADKSIISPRGIFLIVIAVIVIIMYYNKDQGISFGVGALFFTTSSN